MNKWTVVGERRCGGVSENGICASKATTISTLTAKKKEVQYSVRVPNIVSRTAKDEERGKLAQRENSEEGLEATTTHVESCTSLCVHTCN